MVELDFYIEDIGSYYGLVIKTDLLFWFYTNQVHNKQEIKFWFFIRLFILWGWAREDETWFRSTQIKKCL